MPAGLVLAGVIVDRLDFHWLFWLAIAPIVAGAILSATVIRPSPVGAPGHVNIAAAMLLSAGLSAVLLAITETTSWGWGDPRTSLCRSAGRRRSSPGRKSSCAAMTRSSTFA